MLKHHQQFAGGYIYVFGPIIKNTMVTILKTANQNRSKPVEILVYFNGVSEGQFSLLNETYKKRVEEACAFLHPNYKPHITIIAFSKMQNERLYMSDNGLIANLEPGTVIDHTIVSPVYNEWFGAPAVADNGQQKQPILSTSTQSIQSRQFR
ncbi:unnamed protein product [Caenorhabditis brenneri]